MATIVTVTFSFLFVFESTVDDKMKRVPSKVSEDEPAQK